MKNILVTGGAGFIGSHFMRRLLKNHPDYMVVCYDKLTYAGNRKNVQDIQCHTVFGHGIEEHDYLREVIRSHYIDVVVNFAAETHVDRSIKNPRAFIDTDILGVFNLLQCCRKAGVRKFIHISTDEVYGSCCPDYAYTEKDPLRPTSPYSASKAAADLLIQSFIKTYDFPAIIIRPCNNYGTHQYPEKLVPCTIMRLLQGKKAIVHGNGMEIREWLHVGDCCYAIERIMHKGKLGEIYNVGSGFHLENIDMVQYICEGMGFWKNDELPKKEYVEFIGNRPGNDWRYAINSDKLGELLGNRIPTAFFAEELKEIIEWYSTHQTWWDDVDLDANIHGREIDK